MDFKASFSRARRGFREDFRLYLVAVSSLTIAFLCLGVALLTVGNMGAVADHWGSSRRMTVYLRDGAQPRDVEQIRVLLEGLPAVSSATHLTSEAARAEFIRQADLEGELQKLPDAAFPASLEVALAPGASLETVVEVAQRISRFSIVEDVETYRGWFDKLETLLAAGRGAVGLVAMLVMICVLAVIGNTIRLAIAGRRSEIEVMKLCGASDSFVRWPFVIEGAIQGVAAAGTAVCLLVVGFLLLRNQVDATFVAFTGVKTVFLHPAIVLAIVLVGAVFGAAGSAVSLRRYLAV
ncbi:MAG: ABC transporter permease [Myxococcales bacterium]|nr:ABC transporter permease [Myxococcales bacterium]